MSFSAEELEVFSPVRSDRLGLLVPSHAARLALTEADEAVTRQDERLRIRQMVAQIMQLTTDEACLGLVPEAEIVVDPYAYGETIASTLVDHYREQMRQALEDPDVMKLAVAVSVRYESFVTGPCDRKPLAGQIKKIQFSQNSKQKHREKLEDTVRDDLIKEVGEAVYEGANTVFALFAVIPDVVRAYFPGVSTEEAIELCNTVSRSVTRLALDWSGLSKIDEKAALTNLRSAPPKDPQRKFHHLRFNPDRFSLTRCPYSNNFVLLVTPQEVGGVAVQEPDQPRFGCPAFPRGGITKMCRAVERKIRDDDYYRRVMLDDGSSSSQNTSVTADNTA